MEVRRCLGERVVDFLTGLLNLMLERMPEECRLLERGTVDDTYDEAMEKGC